MRRRLEEERLEAERLAEEQERYEANFKRPDFNLRARVRQMLGSHQGALLSDVIDRSWNHLSHF